MTDESIVLDGGIVTVAKPTNIFVGVCPKCKLPSRVENDDVIGADTLLGCLHCSANMTADRLWATETEGVCDLRCMSATGKICECACGGANHAGAYRFNRHKSEETEKHIQRLIQQREKRAEAARKRREKRVAAAAAPFNEWLSSLDPADAALVSWMSSYENVAEAPTGILVDFRLRMMATPGNEVPRPLTEKQMALAWKIVQRMADECEREQNGTPVPEGRYHIHGKVISRRIDADGYAGNTTYKILVQCDGYRLWGNCPTELVPAVWPANPDDLYVEFNADVKRSERDDHFGFFRNPRSAKMTAASRESVSEPQSADEASPRGETRKSEDTASGKRSAPRGSHADCTHEATKAARAKCRRERS